jgi:hypothetical protein
VHLRAGRSDQVEVREHAAWPEQFADLGEGLSLTRILKVVDRQPRDNGVELLPRRQRLAEVMRPQLDGAIAASARRREPAWAPYVGATVGGRQPYFKGWIDLSPTSCCPRRCPPGAFLHPIVCIIRQTKTLLLQGFCPIAGAGFEPATFGL